MKKKILYFFISFSFFFVLNSFLTERSILDLKNKYRLEIEEKNKMPSFGFKENSRGKKNKKFIPFVIKNEGGVQNKQIKITQKGFGPESYSVGLGKQKDFFDEKNRSMEERYDEQDDNDLIDEILKSLEDR